MEAVEHQPQRRMVDIAHQRPSLAVIVDMAAPGQRLIADAQTALSGALGRLGQIVENAATLALGLRRTARTGEQKIGAQFAHHIELALEPVEGALARRAGQPLEVAERLEHRAGQPQFAHQGRHFARAQMGRKQVIFEDFGARKARARNRVQFGLKRAADRNRGDGCFHGGGMSCRSRLIPCRPCADRSDKMYHGGQADRSAKCMNWFVQLYQAHSRKRAAAEAAPPGRTRLSF